jgi:alanine dehydrogenase
MRAPHLYDTAKGDRGYGVGYHLLRARGDCQQTPRPVKTLVSSKFCSRRGVIDPWERTLGPAAGIHPQSSPPPALILNGREIRELMSPVAYLAAAEAAFRRHASGASLVPMPMHIPVKNGGFHIKGALMMLNRAYVAVKLNGNFPGNPQCNGLPTIQGALLLCDAADGSLLAIMDSIEITLKRTAAASALAARYLAPNAARSIAICGCGSQGRAQLTALAEVTLLSHAKAWDVDPAKARKFAREMDGVRGLRVTPVTTVHDATWGSDIIVTATSAQTPFLTKECVAAGTFIAAVGADSPHKSELAPELLADSKIVVDLLAQCALMGDLHHAIEAGLVTSSDVHAELGDLVIGRRPGRTNTEEITVFDSTGVAIQDAASAAWAYERALTRNVGTSISLASGTQETRA